MPMRRNRETTPQNRARSVKKMHPTDQKAAQTLGVKMVAGKPGDFTTKPGGRIHNKKAGTTQSIKRANKALKDKK